LGEPGPSCPLASKTSGSLWTASLSSFCPAVEEFQADATWTVASPSGGQQTLMGRARRRSPAAAAMELTATCPVMCKSAMSRLDRVAASQNGGPIRAARHAAATGGNGECEVQWPNNSQHGAHPPLPQPLVVTGGRRLDHREVCLVNLSVLVTNDDTRTGRKHLRSVLWNRKSWEKQVELSSPGGQTTGQSKPTNPRVSRV
jgi:hypothetical protein